MFYYVYILQSKKDKKLYIGYTADLKKRLERHNHGQNKATKPFTPYKLIFYEAFLNRTDAKKREIYLKSGFGRRTINKLLQTYIQKEVNNPMPRPHSKILARYVGNSQEVIGKIV